MRTRGQNNVGGILSVLPNLGSYGVRRLEMSPALYDLAVGDAPDNYAREFQALAGCGVGSDPVIANDQFVAFGDEI